MNTSRFVGWRKVTTLAPMAALSAAATVVAASAGGPVPTLSAADDLGEDAIVVPEQAVEAPASVSLPDAVSPTTDADIVSASSTSGIPAVALSAYQRAQTIINGADEACGITWQLVAAVGRVESDHGRFGGSQLDENGVATPGIYGVALDGNNNTTQILDTDGGELDNDTTYDRAVGPMQFIPSTWRVVGVDADADGVRDPQNINDAALATAVYLCSGDEDLSTEEGKRAAVLRYNHSEEYVNLVLAIEQAYLAGEYTSVPNAVASANYFVPDPVAPKQNDVGSSTASAAGASGADAAASGSDSASGSGSGSSSGGSPSGGESSTGGGSSSGGSSGSTPSSSPSTAATTKDGGLAGKSPVDAATDLVKDPVGTIANTLTWVQASLQCNSQGKFDNPFKTGDPWDLCMDGLGY